MSAAVADRLRELAQEHAEGRLTLGHYRRLRAPLLDALIGASRESDSDVTQPRAVRQEELHHETDARGAEAPETDSPETDSHEIGSRGAELPLRDVDSSEPSSRSGGRFTVTTLAMHLNRHGRLIAIAGAALIATGLVLSWRRVPTRRAPSAAAPAAGDPAAARADPVQALVQPLIANPDWSDARLLALNGALVAAGQTRLAAAQSTDWFNTFVDQVRSRIKEQQALTGAPLIPGSPLATLAATLGIDTTSPGRGRRVIGQQHASRRDNSR